jgi:hypothetical protein
MVCLYRGSTVAIIPPRVTPGHPVIAPPNRSPDSLLWNTHWKPPTAREPLRGPVVRLCGRASGGSVLECVVAFPVWIWREWVYDWELLGLFCEVFYHQDISVWGRDNGGGATTNRTYWPAVRPRMRKRLLDMEAHMLRIWCTLSSTSHIYELEATVDPVPKGQRLGSLKHSFGRTAVDDRLFIWYGLLRDLMVH